MLKLLPKAQIQWQHPHSTCNNLQNTITLKVTLVASICVLLDYFLCLMLLLTKTLRRQQLLVAYQDMAL